MGSSPGHDTCDPEQDTLGPTIIASLHPGVNSCRVATSTEFKTLVFLLSPGHDTCVPKQDTINGYLRGQVLVIDLA